MQCNLLPSSNLLIKELKINEDTNILITECGKVFIWPLLFANGDVLASPYQI